MTTKGKDKYEPEPQEQDSEKVSKDRELIEVDTSSFEYIDKKEDQN